MTDQPDVSWYLLQLKPNAYRIAERNLKQQGYESFLPMREVTRRRNSQFVTEMKPLFPGYMFVALDPKEGNWRSINGTIGVLRLVSFGVHPVPVPKDLLSDLKRRCDQSGKWLQNTIFKSGDNVTVIGGPFSDFIAKVEQIDDNEKRVWVLLDLLGQKTRVQVCAQQLTIAG